MEIRVGTSGYFYLHWKDKFYPVELPSQKYLEFYSKFFNTVEINSTFYHVPQERTLKNLIKSVKSDFRFSFKVNRQITHSGEFNQYLFQEFEARLMAIKEYIGFILIQFPPSFKYNEKNIKDLLSIESAFKVAIELRNKSWYEQTILNKLSESHNIVYSDFARYSALFLPHDSTIYGRFHGAEGRYRGEYGSLLEKILDPIFKLNTELNQVWLYFNNDYGAAAIHDAKTCIEYLSKFL